MAGNLLVRSSFLLDQAVLVGNTSNLAPVKAEELDAEDYLPYLHTRISGLRKLGLGCQGLG